MMTGGGEWAATSGSSGHGHESPDASELLSEPDEVISERVPLELSEMGFDVMSFHNDREQSGTSGHTCTGGIVCMLQEHPHPSHRPHYRSTLILASLKERSSESSMSEVDFPAYSLVRGVFGFGTKLRRPACCHLWPAIGIIMLICKYGDVIR